MLARVDPDRETGCRANRRTRARAAAIRLRSRRRLRRRRAYAPSASRCRSGISARHGGHHEAHKFIRHDAAAIRCSETREPRSSRSAKTGADSPARAAGPPARVACVAKNGSRHRRPRLHERDHGDRPDDDNGTIRSSRLPRVLGSSPSADETATACLPRFSTEEASPPICAPNSSLVRALYAKRASTRNSSIVFVGENESSLAYVRNLERTGERVGIDVVVDRLPAARERGRDSFAARSAARRCERCTA